MKNDKARGHLLLQGIGLAYVLYLLVDMIGSYQRGESNISIDFVCAILLAFGLAVLLLGWNAWRSWVRDRNAQNDSRES